MSDSSEPGGLGAGPRPSRSDLALFRRGLRQDWPIPPEVKRLLLQRAIDLCDRETADGATADNRDVLGALKVIAAFGNLSAKQQALDLARKKLRLLSPVDGTPKAVDVVREMADSAALYEQEHDAEGGPEGGDPGGAGEVPD